jgi:hypothetical protein
MKGQLHITRQTTTGVRAHALHRSRATLYAMLTKEYNNVT